MDNSGCAAEDLHCMKATIGAAEDPSDASVEAVAAWDGHVRRAGGGWVVWGLGHPLLSSLLLR